MLKGARILISGCTGYLGQLASQAIEAQGGCVIEIGRRFSGLKGREYIPWDLSQQNRPPSLGPFDGFIHLAWDMGAEARRIESRHNVEGSMALAKSVAEAGTKKLIFISTFNASKNAASVYGRQKFEVEGAFTNLGGVSLRTGLVWGNPPGGAFGLLQARILNSAIIPRLFPDTKSLFTCFSGDFQKAVVNTLSSAVSGGPSVLRLAHGVPYSVWDVSTKILSDCKTRRCFVPVPTCVVKSLLKSLELLGFRFRFGTDAFVNLTSPVRFQDRNVPPALDNYIALL